MASRLSCRPICRTWSGVKPGEQAALEVVREGERKTIKLAIGALPKRVRKSRWALPRRRAQQQSAGRLGGGAEWRAEESARPARWRGHQDVQNGPAALIGLRPGDIITHLNNQAITSAKQFAEVAKALPVNRSRPCACCARAAPVSLPSSWPNKPAWRVPRKGGFWPPFHACP